MLLNRATGTPPQPLMISTQRLYGIYLLKGPLKYSSYISFLEVVLREFCKVLLEVLLEVRLDVIHEVLLKVLPKVLRLKSIRWCYE